MHFLLSSVLFSTFMVSNAYPRYEVTLSGDPKKFYSDFEGTYYLVNDKDNLNNNKLIRGREVWKKNAYPNGNT